MLKHLITIIGCVLCLLAVYVYFVSQDLRKLTAKLSKSETDIHSLVASLSNLYKDINSSKKKQRPIVKNEPDQFDEISSEDIKKIINEIPSDDDEDINTCTKDSCYPPAEVFEAEEEAEEAEEETPKELSEEDFDDIKLDQDIDPPTTDSAVEEVFEPSNPDEDLKLLPVEQLRTYTLPYLREYCKKNNLNSKGTKEVLISRIVILTA
jgi:hypothetical protein